MRTSVRSTGLVAVLICTAGCAQMCAPEDVAMGVARLTTLNADALANALNADTECGFEADAVKLGAKIEGEVGTVGTLTLTVTDCELAFSAAGDVTSKNCRDEETRAFGKAKVSGTKTVTGHLTGNLKTPIIPLDADSVVVSLDATFDNFRAERSTGGATMTWISGGITGNMRPRLAVSSESGACAIQTSNTAFDAVKYKPTKAFLKSGDTELEVDIDGSDIQGQYGKGATLENVLTGKLSVWGEEYALPPEGDVDGLDGEYDAAKFVEGYACKENLAQPLTYSCDRTPSFAQGTARGLLKMVGMATVILEKNDTCGFSSGTVVAAGTAEGSTGSVGTLTFSTAANPCAVTLPANTVVSTDCKGNEVLAGGKVTGTTVKTLTGMLTGQQANPIAPLSPNSALFTHQSLVFEKFKLAEKPAGGSAAVSVEFSGTVTAKVRPMLGETTQQAGVFGITTPVAAMEDVVTASGTFTIVNNGLTFKLEVADVALEGFNGSYDGRSNEASGSLKVNGTAFAALPEATLEPAFDQAKFDESYACTPGLKEPLPAD